MRVFFYHMPLNPNRTLELYVRRYLIGVRQDTRLTKRRILEQRLMSEINQLSCDYDSKFKGDCAWITGYVCRGQRAGNGKRK